MVSDKIHHFLIDNLNTAVLLLDEDLTVEYINAAFEALLQVSSTRLKGLPASAIFRDAGSVFKSIETALTTGRPYTRRHEFLDTYSTGPIKVDYSGIPIEIEGQKKFLMELQPIDRFLKINREEAMLSVQDTSKTLIRGLAHEIKNPLGGIRGAAQLLDDEIAEQSLDGETRELCQIIMTETDRLRNLVDRLLGPNQVPKYTLISIHEVTERVDAVDGPMPQTRFVTSKAFEKGLRPIVVINKVDRPGARPDWVMDQVFDLFDSLGATDEQLDFPVIYASALNGIAGTDADNMAEDMTPLYEMIIADVPSPKVDISGPFQMQISALAYDSYVGVIGVGRITRGTLKPGQQVVVKAADGKERKGKVLNVKGYLGLDQVETTLAEAGDIVCINGIDGLGISDTLCDPEHIEALPALSVDEPTVSMTFIVNNSPFAGLEGKYVTTRNIKDRLDQELIHNVALRVREGDSPDKFIVSGRGELHLSVLIETMRREGFEMGVSRPEVVTKIVDGSVHEPFEQVVIDVEEQHQGSVMEELGTRKGEMSNMELDGKGRVRLEFMIPSRGLIGPMIIANNLQRFFD